jgi:Zn-dependent protease with chaperone function
VWRGQRSDYMLAGLIALAIANGFLLGLTLAGLLAAALKVVHGQAPGLLFALIVGAVSANYLVVVSLQRERKLRHGEYELWSPMPSGPEEHPLVARLRGLASASSLDRPPRLGCIDSGEKNAFTVGRSPEEASIILTSGLIEGLTRAELDAVMAQQLAHVERDDVRAAGLADAIADSVEDLSQLKGRFLWGPRAIVTDLRPFIVVTVAMAVVLAVLPSVSPEANVLVALFVIGVLFWLLYAFWQAVKMSWRGLGQAFLYASFFGPLSVIEAALAAPTALVLSRLVSRARVHEADARAVELTGDRNCLISALRHVEAVEDGGNSPWLGERRYSLFVAPGPEAGHWPWLAHFLASHPSIESRVETIAADD